MKTQKYSLFILLAGLLGFLEVSCDDVIQYEQPAVTMLSDAFNTPTDAIASATASYVPLMWELGMTYAPEWWIGDVCSDDALKGGENLSDMSSVYDMENFKTRSDNDVLLTFYRIQYMGAYRCNVAIENVGTMNPEIFKEDPSIQKRVLGEVLFLRALYHFRLVRIFGGVPLADRILRLQSEWKQPRATEAETYEMIYKDLKLSIQYLPEKSKYAPADLGRATKGAARALLMKAYMNNHLYEEAKLQGDSIINSGEYSLVADYNEQFTVEGENGRESIFETQYIAEGSSAYEGNDGQLGYARGTFTVVMTRPRWTNAPFGGWGFNRPTQELYDEFETGDLRREAAIYAPTFDQVDPSDDNTNNLNVYLGNRYTARKYIMMNPDTTFIPIDLEPRAPINRKEIRYADVLLMYAEACCKKSSPDLNRAKWALEEVRKRAREYAGADVLPTFPNYKIKLEVVGQAGERQLQDNAADLYLAIQHERRVELALEGHRWFDLKRWGLLADVMNYYRGATKTQIREHMDPFEKGKHELFPIPQEERDLNSPMEQNPGYN